MKRIPLTAAGAAAIAAAALVAATPAFAQGPLRDADADQNGQITRAEIDARAQEVFREADANRNGALSQAEFQAHAEARRAEHEARRAEREAQRAAEDAEQQERRRGRRGPPREHDPAQRFAQLDWNQDGAVSFDEFAAPHRVMAARMDRNGDGVIAEDEMRPGRGHMRHGPPGAAPQDG